MIGIIWMSDVVDFKFKCNLTGHQPQRHAHDRTLMETDAEQSQKSRERSDASAICGCIRLRKDRDRVESALRCVCFVVNYIL